MADSDDSGTLPDVNTGQSLTFVFRLRETTATNAFREKAKARSTGSGMESRCLWSCATPSAVLKSAYAIRRFERRSRLNYLRDARPQGNPEDEVR